MFRVKFFDSWFFNDRRQFFEFLILHRRGEIMIFAIKKSIAKFFLPKHFEGYLKILCFFFFFRNRNLHVRNGFFCSRHSRFDLPLFPPPPPSFNLVLGFFEQRNFAGWLAGKSFRGGGFVTNSYANFSEIHLSSPLILLN